MPADLHALALPGDRVLTESLPRLADHALPPAAPLDEPDPVADLSPRRRVEAKAAVEGRGSRACATPSKAALGDSLRDDDGIPRRSLRRRRPGLQDLGRPMEGAFEGVDEPARVGAHQRRLTRRRLPLARPHEGSAVFAGSAAHCRAIATSSWNAPCHEEVRLRLDRLPHDRTRVAERRLELHDPDLGEAGGPAPSAPPAPGRRRCRTRRGGCRPGSPAEPGA